MPPNPLWNPAELPAKERLPPNELFVAPKWLPAKELLPKRVFETEVLCPAPKLLKPREVLFEKCELSMCDRARLVETADEPRELAESEFVPPRAAPEFEFTPGVKLRELPALVLEPVRAPFAPAPFTPPRTELFALAVFPPPLRPIYGIEEREFAALDPGARLPALKDPAERALFEYEFERPALEKEFERPALFENDRFCADE